MTDFMRSVMAVGPWCSGCDVLFQSWSALNSHVVEAVVFGVET